MNGSDAEHRLLREALGSYALGHLPEEDAGAVRAHLDGCPACRAELAEIAPVVDDLGRVDVSRLSALVTPPPDLGGRIMAAVAHERVLVQARTAREQQQAGRSRVRSRLLAVAAAVAVLGAGFGAGLATRPEPGRPAVAIPLETVAVLSVDGVNVTSGTADVIAHTWGVEAKIVATGLQAGRTYQAAFRSQDGRLLPAGEFLGTGAAAVKCNLQAALLRGEATGFVVMDAAGATVITATLT